MSIVPAKRVTALPPYLFKEMDDAAEIALAKGVDLIMLHNGDPDIAPPQHVLEIMKQGIDHRPNHYYPGYRGLLDFRKQCAQWMLEKYGVELDAATEVVSLLGSKEGIAHAPLAFADPGDVVLVPDPGFPMFTTTATFAGAEPWHYPLTLENDFLADFSSIPQDIADRARLMILNYPHNPTSATADLAFFTKAVEFAKRNDIVLLQDHAYAEVFDGQRPPSILQVPGAKEVAIETFSFSKTFSAPGWRLGFAVGGAPLINALARVKEQVDSGAFNAIQRAVIAGMADDQGFCEDIRKAYVRRRTTMSETLRQAGYSVFDQGASMFIWVKTPHGESSKDYCKRALEEQGVLLAPGTGFGKQGEGYFRIALVLPDERLAEAAQRLVALL